MKTLIATCLVLLSLVVSQIRAGEPVMDRLYRNRVEVESARWLSVRLYDAQVDLATLRPEMFLIESSDDAELASVAPLRVSSRRRAVRVAVRTELLVKETAIFLELPAPMNNGKTYRVRAEGINAIKSLQPTEFDDHSHVSDLIRVNQLGYLPDLPKHAYVGQYLGTAGAMPLEPGPYELLASDGTVAFHATLTRRAVNEQLVGQQVLEADFTTFNTPGVYSIRVPGVGVSPPFVIGPNATTRAFANLMRGNWHQRCGDSVPHSVSRFSRPACHLDDAVIDPAAEKVKFVEPKNPPLYPVINQGAQKAVRGHHDAGDYGKYTTTGASYVHAILTAYTAFPGRFDQDNLNFPTSGNGIPDLLEEAKWELDWLERMQDSDGGVFGVIRPQHGGYENMMPPANNKRFFFPKDTPHTAAYAAALALASRHESIRKHYPEDAKRYLVRAEKAWDWLEKNTRFVQTFHYGAIYEDRDERAWAAMELWAATGKQAYHDKFLQFDITEKRWGWMPLVEGLGSAVLSYVLLPPEMTDAVMRQRCLDELTKACDTFVTDSSDNPYRLSMAQETIKHGRYGWLFPGDSYGFPLLIAFRLTGNAEYLNTAWNNFSYTCGQNAQGYFLVTGLGSKRNIEVVDNESWYDDIIEPVGGIPLGVGAAEFYWLNQYEKRIGEGTFPDGNAWPLLHRWYDGFNVRTEFTMGPMAREMIVAGYFASAAMGKTNLKRPAVRIQADHLRGAAPLAVNFRAVTDAESSPVREVFWDFDDESFSTSIAPTHIFADTRRMYRVTVTVIDENGQQAWDTVVIHPGTAASGVSTTPPATGDTQTLAYFPMAQSLAARGQPTIAFKERLPQPADRTPMQFQPGISAWAAEVPDAENASARFHGLEQLRLRLAEILASAPADAVIELRANVYIRAFAGWGWRGDPMIFGVELTRENSVGLKQATWERQNKPLFFRAGDRLMEMEPVSLKLPRDRWLQLAIRITPDGRTTFTVDGEPLLKEVDTKLSRNALKSAELVIGPIDGYVSGVEVRTIPFVVK